MRYARLQALLMIVFGLPLSAWASDKGFEQLLSDLDALRTEHEVAGFALTVFSTDHGLQNAVAGLADLDSERPVTTDTMFRIGSITKTFNALALMLLVEQGRLDLDAPVRKIAPAMPLRNSWADSDPVRVIHLLEHSSGLLDLTREEFDHNEPFASLEAALAWRSQARVVQWQPGLHHVYSNVNAGLAGRVIEQVSGQDYQSFITERLLRPLGMQSAGLFNDQATRDRLATGYDSDGHTPIPYWHMIFPPLGAINVTPHEMGALLELFLRQGRVGSARLLDAASIARMERPATTLAARNGLAYGYGPGLDQWLHNGLLWYGHGGDGDGYLSRFGYNRDTNTAYFLVINAFKQAVLNQMRDRVQDYLASDTSAPPPPPVGIETEPLQSLAGTFVAVTRRFPWQSQSSMNEDRLQIQVIDGELFTRTSNGQRSLVPVDSHRFRRPDQPIATIAIAEYDGELYLQADFGNYRRVDQATR